MNFFDLNRMEAWLLIWWLATMLAEPFRVWLEELTKQLSFKYFGWFKNYQAQIDVTQQMKELLKKLGKKRGYKRKVKQAIKTIEEANEITKEEK